MECLSCGDPSQLRCGNCGGAYCSPDCQRKHWRDHKADCRAASTPPFDELAFLDANGVAPYLLHGNRLFSIDWAGVDPMALAVAARATVMIDCGDQTGPAAVELRGPLNVAEVMDALCKTIRGEVRSKQRLSRCVACAGPAVGDCIA